MSEKRKVIVYIAASLDGFIAKPNDNLDFLNMVDREGEDYGYFKFIEDIDTVILGRKTYDWVMTKVDVFPHADKEAYVITRTSRQAIGKTQFYTGDLKALISELRNRAGKNIFVDGGAEVVNELWRMDLIDEIIISIIPIVVGAGVSLFSNNIPERKLQLLSSKRFESGLVQVHYNVKQH